VRIDIGIIRLTSRQSRGFGDMLACDMKGGLLAAGRSIGAGSSCWR